MRVLGRIRLSKLTDESTSAARQRQIITNWAKSNDHEIVGWAEDLDVSGSIDPFEAPALSEWWDRHDEWDILCAWKLDRVGRRAIPLNKVFGWMLDHGKTLVCVSDNIDLSTWVGRLVANVIAGVAEGELEAISERNRASRRALLESGRWPGGRVPWGYKPLRLPNGGYRLQQDPEESAWLRTVIQRIVDGAPIKGVAEAEGIPDSTMRKLLRSKSLLGHAISKGQTVRDREGNPVLLGEPILTQHEWDELQAALLSRRVESSKKDVGPMTGVIECLNCGAIMYHRKYSRDYGKRMYRYYHCPTHKDMLDAEMIEEALESAFRDAVGSKPVLERVYQAPENHQIALDEAVRAVDELSALLGTITSDTMRSRLLEQMRALDFRIASLEKLPSRPGGWIYKETGQTFTDRWDVSSIPDRRDLLIKSGIRFRIKKIAGNAIQSELYEPAEAADLLNAKKPLSEERG